MPTQRAFVVAAILAAAFAGSPAHATEAEPGPKPRPGAVEARPMGPSAAQCAEAFMRYDANKDGKLTYAEYVAGAWGSIRFIEAPTPAEVADFKRRFLAAAKSADRNRDGWLSKPEHLAMCQAGGDL